MNPKIIRRLREVKEKHTKKRTVGPESMELVLARTYEMLGECRVKMTWQVWDHNNMKWRTVDKLSRVLRQLSPAGVHQLHWDFLNFIDTKRKEQIDES